ncbi:hypothetical protein ACEZ3G_06505 [Maribacter algicola]|uniref:Uncharacterized protein n=1 Tax=Meishania litoralis TaxID=3434685 RepID=A0ACC7LHY6_9FLAO
MNEFDNTAIERLKSELVDHLNWGEAAHWSTRNFERLSEKIFETTSIQLSVSTLKRFLGKVAYYNKPAPATLDAIAAFLGYEGYMDYRWTVKKPEEPISQISKKKIFIYGLGVLVLMATVAAVSFINHGTQSIDPSKTSFSIKKVTTGLPNTVVFEYDVTKVDANFVEIQQDWDSTKRHKVNPSNTIFTHYYEYPGYYNAKLLVNGFVVSEKDLFIPSDGWMSAISYLNETKPPRYLRKNEFESDSVLRISTDVHNDILIHPDEVSLEFFNAFANPEFEFENFDFKANVRFNTQSGKVPCEFRKLIFFGTKKFIRVPFSVPGCVSQNTLRLGSLVIDGEENDLSDLSVESGEWSNIRVINVDNRLSIYLEDKMVFETDLIDDFGKLAGIRFSFNGSGEVKDLHLSSKGNVLLSLK